MLELGTKKINKESLTILEKLIDNILEKIVRKKILRDSISIWLDINLKTLNKRVRWNKKRPLLNDKNNQMTISKLYTQRKNIYKLAKYRINCNQLNKEDIVKKIIFFYEKQ